MHNGDIPTKTLACCFISTVKSNILFKMTC